MARAIILDLIELSQQTSDYYSFFFEGWFGRSKNRKFGRLDAYMKMLIPRERKKESEVWQGSRPK
jgi:hypothetical protein